MQGGVALGLFVDGLKTNGDMDGGSVYGFVYVSMSMLVVRREEDIYVYILFVIERQGGIYVLTYECICMSRRFIYSEHVKRNSYKLS